MSMSYNVIGTLKSIGEIESFPSGFTKRQIVVETGGKYPQLIKLDLLKEKTEYTRNLAEGDGVTVSFDLRGNEHNGRVYTNLVAWRIQPHVHEDLSDAPAEPAQGTQPVTPQSAPVEDDEKDFIPF